MKNLTKQQCKYINAQVHQVFGVAQNALYYARSMVKFPALQNHASLQLSINDAVAMCQYIAKLLIQH